MLVPGSAMSTCGEKLAYAASCPGSLKAVTSLTPEIAAGKVGVVDRLVARCSKNDNPLPATDCNIVEHRTVGRAARLILRTVAPLFAAASMPSAKIHVLAVPSQPKTFTGRIFTEVFPPDACATAFKIV